MIPPRGTTVVDVTYKCNARCRYCRWGDGSAGDRTALDLEKLLIPAETLQLLGTRRVVISGGEPRLHPNLPEILAHYANLVEQVVVITNGYGLDRAAAEDLLSAGATGITVSLDSVDAIESFLTRRTPPALHGKILKNIADLAAPDRDYELGINSTVSSVTANWLTVRDMLVFGASLSVDFVKFQPVFDDGYVSENSPDLFLGPGDVGQLLDVASRLEAAVRPATNPPGFWRDVAAVAGGGGLSARGCALGPSDAISTGGRLSICLWVGSSCYGAAGGTIRDADRIRVRFESDKQKCDVGFHCFCNQGMGHTWQERLVLPLT